MANTLPFGLIGTAAILLCVGAADIYAQDSVRPAPKTSGKPGAVSDPRPWSDKEIEWAFDVVNQKCANIGRPPNTTNSPAGPPHRSQSPNIPKGPANQWPKPPDYGPLPKDPETYWQWFCGLFWR